MDYSITVLTLSRAIPTGASGINTRVPWTHGGPISFTDPVLSTATVTDDDPLFNTSRYSQTESGQTLTTATTFGSGTSTVTVAAGTRLTNFTGSILQDSDGAQFVAIFPREFIAGSEGPELGNKFSAMIFPLSRSVNGVQVQGVFDPTRTYTYQGVRQANQTADGVAYAVPQASPCFVQGTLILTADGPRPIETLRAGDLVATLDAGWQPILWLGYRQADLDLRPQDAPIRIAAGALGAGAPARDLRVSPQHRMLVRSPVAVRLVGASETLVAARHLLGPAGIEVQRPDGPVIYWHLLLARHHVISAEGAWTESLYPGPMAMLGFTPCQRAQIRAALPDLDRHGPPAFARPVTGGRQARQLTQRHVKNAKPLVGA